MSSKCEEKEEAGWEVSDAEADALKLRHGKARTFVLRYDCERDVYVVLAEKEAGRLDSEEEIVVFPAKSDQFATDGLSCPQCQGGPIYPDARGGYDCGHCDCWFEIKEE